MNFHRIVLFYVETFKIIYYYEQIFQLMDVFSTFILMISLPKRQSNYLLTVHYRNNLQLSENDIENNAINFLDFKLILNENNILNIDICYMRNEFPFKVNLFTHYNSC